MNEQFIPCCYFPTTVIFVDDNDQYLKNLGLEFSETLPCQLFNHPLNALDFLIKEYNPHPFTQECLLHAESFHVGHRNIDINLNTISQQIYNPKRFNEISVMVIDYAMHGINGIELCANIKDKNIRKIILTGEADATIAIDAFNKGIIDGFIRKDDPEFLNLLREKIAESQQKYFKNLSLPIINSMISSPDCPNPWLDDPRFVQFFHDLCARKNICEYYLLDDRGHFLLLNEMGEPAWFVIKGQELMTAMIFEVESCDATVPKNILKSIKQKSHLLYFYDQHNLWETPQEWHHYLFPCHTLEGKTNYYYAMIENCAKYEIQLKNILSYHSFLKNNSPL